MGIVSVPVSTLKPGLTLGQDVLTRKGNLLFPKGQAISNREIEILRAFFISAVAIEVENEEEYNTAETQKDDGKEQISPFTRAYDMMIQLLKSAFISANVGNLPVLEIRTQLENLLAHMDQYNVLTFIPPRFKVGEFVYHNSIMVSLTSYNLGRWHGLPQKDWIQIALAGLLHDIGNIKVDPNLLQKPGKLTVEEFEEIKKHTITGYHILKNIAGINEGAKLAALQHHEREDGSGYPLGVKGDKIHDYAKIIAIADIFHAMTGLRSYKEAISPYLVLEKLVDQSFGKLNPALVQTFIHRVTVFHNGTIVRLSDNSVGEIIFSDRTHPTRPWVKVNGKIINLVTERSLYIRELIQT